MISLSTKKKTNRLRRWFSICPIRHTLTIIFALLIGAYFLFRRNEAFLTAIANGFVHPWHKYVSQFCALFPFSLGEAVIIIGVLGIIVYIIIQVAAICRKRNIFLRIYRTAITAAMIFSIVYGGFCTLWGVYYYTADFEEQSGIYGKAISVEELETVTRYFTAKMNEYSALVARDETGAFAEDIEAVFDYSSKLYDAVSAALPCLEGPAIEPKPFLFSEALSYMTFTGFFFPFTGEANINVHCPASSIPSTIAHEIAHQRGVAEEDEANFVAVLASMEDGNPIYCYSACLMAYTYLGNALYGADYDAWADNYRSIVPEVIVDMRNSSSYWDTYRDTKVNTASDAVYTGFLKSYGQTEGLKTYGKCIDLLVAYYYDEACQYLNEVE
ncbi:MAG: DUF3810 domain-containing protein [Oscillospiraceae bacterium]|nr:DUF3810 domain-containing protein [Oscillospiraceae bacterium]